MTTKGRVVIIAENAFMEGASIGHKDMVEIAQEAIYEGPVLIVGVLLESVFEDGLMLVNIICEGVRDMFYTYVLDTLRLEQSDA